MSIPTPEALVAGAYRAVDRELARQGAKAADYEAHILMTERYNKLAHAEFLRIAQKRETTDAETLGKMEHQAYILVLQTAVSALMALGHFPYPNSATSAPLSGGLLDS
jgi:hypothetical protein